MGSENNLTKLSHAPAQGHRFYDLHSRAEAQKIPVQPGILGEHRPHLQPPVVPSGDTVSVKLIVYPPGQAGRKAQHALHPEQGRNLPGVADVRRRQTAMELPSGDGKLQNPAQAEGAVVLPVQVQAGEGQHREDIVQVLTEVLYQFPVREIAVQMPRWLFSLPADHWLRRSLFDSVTEAAKGITHIRDAAGCAQRLSQAEYVTDASVKEVLPGEGAARIRMNIDEGLFYKVLGETSGLEIENEEELMRSITDLAAAKREYDKIKDAIDQVNATGYGIVMPSIDELTLDEPEIVKQGGRYGVRLRASAPSIHLMRADITTEVAPIVGSEKQSEDLVMYLLKEFEDSPEKIWQSNIFGKSLHELVNEGLHNKLSRMPGDARIKLQETIERIINEGCSGRICIIL